MRSAFAFACWIFWFLGLRAMKNFQMRQLTACVENGLAFEILIYRGYCSAMSCISRLKHPFGLESPYHLLHMNSCRYSNKKLGLLLPFVVLNLCFAELQLLSACCVWTPVAGSTKWREWLTVLWCKPSPLCNCR